MFKEVKVRFPDEYKDLLKVVNPKDTDVILEYCLYDYKIELKLGNEKALLYSRARPISPKEFKVIK